MRTDYSNPNILCKSGLTAPFRRAFLWLVHPPSWPSRRALPVAFCLALLLAAAGGTANAQAVPPRLPSALVAIIQQPATFATANVLAANVAETVTVPTIGGEMLAVVISTDSACPDLYLRGGGGTAAVPTTEITDGSASQHNPPALRFPQTDPAYTFSIIAPTACKVIFTWWRL